MTHILQYMHFGLHIILLHLAHIHQINYSYMNCNLDRLDNFHYRHHPLHNFRNYLALSQYRHHQLVFHLLHNRDLVHYLSHYRIGDLQHKTHILPYTYFGLYILLQDLAHNH